MESSIQQCSGLTCMSINNAATSGVIAGVTAPFLMALGFLIWDATWKKAGGSAFALNLFKCNLASIAFLIMCFIDGFVKDEFKVDQYQEYYNAESIGFLVLSSTLGILIGDTLWLVALTEIGAARVLVVDAIKPFVAAILGRVLLGETLQPVAFTGIFLTVVGILIVSLDKERKDVDDNNDNNDDEEVCNMEAAAAVDAIEIKQTSSLKQNYLTLLRSVPSGKKYGYLCAVTNVIFDAYGSLLTKQHGVGMTTWGINLIRFGFAGVTMTIMSSIMRMQHFLIQNRNQQNQQEHISHEITTDISTSTYNNWYKLPSMKYKPWIKVSIGVMLVTFLCPSLSNYALFQIPLALAITLGSLTPLYALFLECPIKGNKPTLKSFIGSVFAIAGVVILSIWK